jgi:hypothetical protein
MLIGGAGFSSGAFSWVSTASTPGTSLASVVSMPVIRPRAIVA